jgi:hypothetical protein
LQSQISRAASITASQEGTTVSKRQRAGALQDASRLPDIPFRAPASWSAAALRRFSPALKTARQFNATSIFSFGFGEGIRTLKLADFWFFILHS